MCVCTSYFLDSVFNEIVLCVFLHQVYSQGAGNNVSVSDTVFLRNRAGVGSALMFGSFLYVQNRNESYTYETRNK